MLNYWKPSGTFVILQHLMIYKTDATKNWYFRMSVKISDKKKKKNSNLIFTQSSIWYKSWRYKTIYLTLIVKYIVLPFVHRFNMYITEERRSGQQIENDRFSEFEIQCSIQGEEYTGSCGFYYSLKFNAGTEQSSTIQYHWRSNRISWWYS